MPLNFSLTDHSPFHNCFFFSDDVVLLCPLPAPSIEIYKLTAVLKLVPALFIN